MNMSGRILRATLGADNPTMLNVTNSTNGKLLIQNAGVNPVWVGYDRTDVLAASAVNYFVIPAGVILVFDQSNGVGFLAQDTGLWFSAQGAGGSEVQIWVANQV